MLKRLLCFLCICNTFFIYAQTKPDALKLYKSGDYLGAIAVCEKELKDNPQNMDSYVVLCWSLVKNKQYSEANVQATNARKISKYDHRIIEILAEAKYHLGYNDAALELFQEYISLVSTNGSRLGIAYYYIGEIFILKGKYEHADIALSQGVRVEPLNELWWTRLGYAREMSNNYNSAAIAYQKALNLNPALQDAIQGQKRVMQKIRGL